MADLANDPRIDPRIKAVLSAIPPMQAAVDVESRDVLLARGSTPEAIAQRAMLTQIFEAADNEEIAPSKGLSVTEHTVTSQPDGNTINVRVIRPDGADGVPGVYYIHGGGMQIMSCYDGNYRAWGRIIAANGVAVAMVDFRNAIAPSSVEEVAPFPAGLDDCVSGLKWFVEQAPTFGVDPNRIIVAGESGGGNLTPAPRPQLNQGGDIGLIRGLFALCSFIPRRRPPPPHPPSTQKNAGPLPL